MGSGETKLHVMHVVRMGGIGGGMEKGLINVANRLPEEFRISLCIMDAYEEFSTRLNRPGAQFHLLPAAGGGVDWKWVSRLAALFRREKADIIHSHTWGTFAYSVLAARLAGIPIIHGEHGKNIHELNEKNRPKDWTRRILGRSVDRLITVSDPLRDEWIEKFRMPPAKTLYLPNGVDLTRFKPGLDPQACRQSFALPANAFVIGSVGRLDPIKNYSLLIRALPLLKSFDRPIVVALLGDGPCREEVESLAEKLGVRDKLYLPGIRPDVEKFLAALDVFTLPSLSEGMSNVVLEAMAAGCPVVCPDISGHRPLIDPRHDEGILLDPYNEQTLAETLLALSADPERRRTLSEQGRAKIERQFTLEQMVRRHVELYHEVAAGHIVWGSDAKSRGSK